MSNVKTVLKIDSKRFELKGIFTLRNSKRSVKSVNDVGTQRQRSYRHYTTRRSLNHTLTQILSVAMIASAICGCSFKKDPESSSSPPAEGVVARFDWGRDTNLNDAKFLKASRSLILAADLTYRTAQPITLPVSVPNPLLVINDGVLSNLTGIDFVKAYAYLKNQRVELPVRFESSGNDLRFSIEALQAVFSSEVYQTNSLEVEVFAKSSRLATFVYLLRTPPSAMQSETVSLAEVRERKELALETGLKDPVVNGNKYALSSYQVFTNSESQEVELELPIRLNGTLSQE